MTLIAYRVTLQVEYFHPYVAHNNKLCERTINYSSAVGGVSAPGMGKGSVLKKYGPCCTHDCPTASSCADRPATHKCNGEHIRRLGVLVVEKSMAVGERADAIIYCIKEMILTLAEIENIALKVIEDKIKVDVPANS